VDLFTTIYLFNSAISFTIDTRAIYRPLTACPGWLKRQRRKRGQLLDCNKMLMRLGSTVSSPKVWTW